MRFYKNLFAIFVLGVLFFGFLLRLDLAEAALIEEGQEALAFTGTNFIDNQPFDLNDDLKNKIILLDFGSIYCSSCMVTVPNLIKLSKEYSNEQLAIFNIYLDIYNPQRVIKFFKGFARDLRFALLIDQKLMISRQYGVDTLPTTILIDKKGIVRRVIVGYTEADEKEITKMVDNLIMEIPTVSPAPSKHEEPLLVFTPESFTKTTLDSIFLVGYVRGAGVKDVSFKLNNLPERMTRTKDNVFHVKSNLSLAMNLIEIKGQVEEGKTKSESVIIFREPKLGMQIKSELPEFKFHVDDEKKPCVKCHKLAMTPQERGTQQSTQVCLKCHGDLMGQIYVHGPVSVGGCLPCHDYTSFPVKYELRAEAIKLCFSCHEGMKERIDKSNVHGPVAVRICVVCHNPHGSSERYLLKKRLDRLCISCHQDILRDYAKEFIHTPVREGQCAGCHDPHATDFRWFLKKYRDDLCSLCHEEGTYMHTHRVGVLPTKEFAPGQELPLLDGNGRVTCITCHFVHAGDYDKLVRGTTDSYCNMICH